MRYLCLLSLFTGFAILAAGCGIKTSQDASEMTTGTSMDITGGAHLEPMTGIPLEEGVGPGESGDKFDHIVENDFERTANSPLSTLSIDVDTASYSKVRQFLNRHRLPPADAVRIEELINYFNYDYSEPADEHPFAANVEVAECPWTPGHRLVRVGIKGKEMKQSERPVSNLVFLVDCSGSMKAENKLPLVKKGLRMLVEQLEETDSVAIATYASSANVVLRSTPGNEQQKILAAIDSLQSGGSTAGGAGLEVAYSVALQNYIKGGTNRVILCTDGDFNVGTTSPGELVRQVEQYAKQGVQMSVLGFGMGNHNDAMLEEVSNKADGNYAFVDTKLEARKVLVEQMSGTLVTIAKDVKIQVEFNPAKVAGYRLIGYENRRLATEDFQDDKKDAGEIGAGHCVTALYEVVPVGVDSSVKLPEAIDLKYQNKEESSKAEASDELLTVHLRYKLPDAETSTPMSLAVLDGGQQFGEATPDFQFAAAIASFGMLLRGSQYKGDSTYDGVLEIAAAAKGNDPFGYRGEFLALVKTARALPN